MFRPVFVLLTIAGCKLHPNRGEAPVIPPEELYIDFPDQALGNGRVGDGYDQALDVSGGDPPYQFVEIDGMPGGLSVNADGHVVGTATEAGRFTFPLLALDSSGRSKTGLVTMTVTLDPVVVKCGDTIDGTLTTDAIAPDGSPDLGELDGVAWLAVELPDGLTTTVDLVFRNDGRTTLYVERPNETIGSWDLDNLYVPKGIEQGLPSTVTLDPGTDPSLTGFVQQTLIPMVLVASSPGDWELTVECSDGPVFTLIPQYPTELGTPFGYDFDVYGADNDDVRIWTDDPLPSWILWDEATGTISSASGLADDVGVWEIDIHAETPDGRSRTERTIFGVYDVLPAVCNESVALTSIEETYFEGEYYSYYDPRGYDVLRIDLTEDIPSSIVLRAQGSDSHYLGLADAIPDFLKFYGGAERLYIDGEAAIGVSPLTYPSTRNYVNEGSLYFSAGSVGSDIVGLQVSVDCDFDPKPDHAALPVFAPLEAVDLQLRGIGGEPPYAWSATGLPAGLTLQRDGRLTGTTAITGTFPVTLTLVDRDGAEGSQDYDLQVGTDAACLGHRRVYCGESFSNEFTEAYYNDNGSKDSTRTFCYVNDTGAGVGLELYSEDGQYRVDVADPGILDKDNVTNVSQSTYVAFVDYNVVTGVPIDQFSWPNIDDYPGLPVFVTLRAYDPGEYTVRFVCAE